MTSLNSYPGVQLVPRILEQQEATKGTKSQTEKDPSKENQAKVSELAGSSLSSSSSEESEGSDYSSEEDASEGEGFVERKKLSKEEIKELRKVICIFRHCSKLYFGKHVSNLRVSTQYALFFLD